MYRSKFIQLYQILNKRERALLRKWAASPLHNHHEALKKLINYVIDLRTLTPKNLERTAVFALLYGKVAAYDDLKMRHLLSLGVQSIQNFVRFLVQEKEPTYEQKKVFTFYQQRKLPTIAKKKLRQAQTQLTQQPHRSGDFYDHQYHLEVTAFELQGTDQRSSQTNLQPLLNHLEHYFVFHLLRWACTALTHQNLYKTQYQLPLIDHVLNQAANGTYEGQPTILLYYHAYRCLSDTEAPTHFNTLKTLLLQEGKRLPQGEQKNLYLIAINHCVKQLNTKGATHLLGELFELYKVALSNGMLLEESYLSQFAYTNINAVALRLTEFEWAAAFIEEYTPLLRPAVRKAYKHHAIAKLAFVRGDYDRARLLLLQTEYDDVFLNIDARIMLLKLYYLHQEIAPLEALLISSSRYLERQKMLSYHKNNYQNVLRFVRRLLHLAPYDQEGRQKLRHDLEQTHPLTERTWLLNQLPPQKKASTF